MGDVTMMHLQWTTNLSGVNFCLPTLETIDKTKKKKKWLIFTNMIKKNFFKIAIEKRQWNIENS